MEFLPHNTNMKDNDCYFHKLIIILIFELATTEANENSTTFVSY